jgi:aromatic-L-amino-acid decarboxylase
MIWRAFGREGMAAFMREHIRLVNLLADWIRIDKRFELAAPLVMPVVCFRFVGADKDPPSPTASPARTPGAASKLDILNSEIVERINASGRAYLTQTKLRGRTVMRIGLGNVLTTEQHLRNVWELIQETSNELGRGGSPNRPGD